MAEFEGFDELVEQLELLKQNVQDAQAHINDALSRALETSSQRVERGAKKRLTEQGAVETGTLRSSYGYMEVNPLHYKIGTPVEYAPFVEWGTSVHTIEADEGYLRFEGRDGEIVFRKSVEHPGALPRPHLYPALSDAELDDEIQKEIEELFEEAFG